MFLVELEAEILFQQRRETEGPNPQQLRGHPRVEQILHLPAIVLMQQAQIVVGVVQYDFDLWIFDQRPQARRLANRQGIDDGLMAIRRQLQQIDAVDEAMKTRALGVERDGSDR